MKECGRAWLMSIRTQLKLWKLQETISLLIDLTSWIKLRFSLSSDYQ